jgi:hypothetical protein
MDAFARQPGNDAELIAVVTLNGVCDLHELDALKFQIVIETRLGTNLEILDPVFIDRAADLLGDDLQDVVVARAHGFNLQEINQWAAALFSADAECDARPRLQPTMQSRSAWVTTQ